MSEARTQVSCPSCGHRFNAEEALETQLMAQLEEAYTKKAQQQAEQFAKQKAEVDTQKKLLEESRQAQDRVLDERLEAQKKALLAQAKKEAGQAMELQLIALKKDNEEQQAVNLKLKKREVELLQKESGLKREKEEAQVELEKQLLTRQAQFESTIRETEQEKSVLRFKEYEKRLSDQNKLIDEMKRKVEQGSTQMQGEVQELVLEELLNKQFPFDEITEVAKGVRGADVIQQVIDPYQKVCGSIIFESKRTKAFAGDWIEKLKMDQRNQGADVAVIVTQTLPSNMDHFGFRDGVWVCRFSELQSLVFVLREMLLRTHAVRSAEENKGDKMHLLYQYLTGTEFKQRVEAIVEGFTGLKSDLEKEKMAMQRIWKSREKQIEKVVHSTIDMYGAVQGIAGSSVQTIPALELGAEEDDDFRLS